MTVATKKDLMRAIDVSAQDLHKKIDMHRCLMATVLDQRVSDRTLQRAVSKSLDADTSRLKRAIEEAIEVLDRTRKSFKSKQLQALRKSLTQVLVES
jgi:hypothetical protein